MTVRLPKPIAAYVAANATLDLERMLAPFSDDAIAHDEHKQHSGREALRAWIQTSTIDNRAVFTPDACREEDGRYIVDGETTGDFPGSPIRFTFFFTLKDDSITDVEIH